MVVPLLAGLSLGVYVLVDQDMRWREQESMRHEISSRWQPHPGPGMFLTMPESRSQNWTELGDSHLFVRYYDGRLIKLAECGGPQNKPAECRERLQALLAGEVGWLRYESSSQSERWAMWALPVHDSRGRVIGVLEMGLGRHQADELLASLTGALLAMGCLSVAGALLLSGLLARHLALPMETLAAAMTEVRCGSFSATVPLQGPHEMISIAHNFNAMVSELAQVFDGQKRFLADASHELKTPLTSIGAMVELLQYQSESLKPERRERAWKVVQKEVERMNRLIHDLLLLSRFEQSPRRVDWVDLGSAIRDQVEDYRVRHPQVQPYLATNLQVALRLDREGWTRCLGNLLDNAVAHTPPGGRVWVTTYREGSCYVVEVADEGSGIPPEDLPRVTRRFYRSDLSRSRNLGGTGLGLAIVSSWLQTAGGRLEITSQLGRGTHVRLCLPL